MNFDLKSNLLIIFLSLLFWSCEDKKDSTPPTISVSNDFSEQIVSGISKIIVLTDDNSGIDKVEFIINDLLVSTDTQSPYEYDWNTNEYVNLSLNTLKVISYDNFNNFVEKEIFNIVVDNRVNIWDQYFDINTTTIVDLELFRVNLGELLPTPIPPQIGDLVNLKILNLNLNRLNETFPDELWTLSSLEELNLNDNFLSGNIPDDISELEVAGGMIGKGIETILSPNSGLPIPIDSEIVIEAKVDLHNMVENTLGEFGNQYGTEVAPMCEVTSIMKRKDAMFYNVMAGRAKEHNNLGYLTIYGLSKGVCTKIKESFSFVKDVAIHFDTKIGPLMHVVIAIEKSSDNQPEKIINEAFNLNLGFFNLSWMAKRVIIVDDDIDINNMDDVEWATWTRMGRAEKMHLFSDFITWEIDRAALPDKTSLRVGVDATKDMDYFDDLVKPIVPGIDQINLKDYL